MSDFDMKKWLDSHVVPLLNQEPNLRIHHPFWNGMPPRDVLVIAMAGELEENSDQEFDPSAWPRAIQRLLQTDGFRFDFTREQIAISHEGGIFNAFGGDGAPLFNPEGLASARLFRKEDDGIGLILQVACRYPNGTDAAAATKTFYGLFEENPLEVCQKYGAVFGQA